MIRGALYWFKESIWFVRVKNLVAIHYRHKVFGVAEVNDIVGITRKHVDALDIVTGDFEFYDFVSAEFTLLYKTVSRDHNEELPFGVVPVLAFGDARLRDVDAHLATV